MPVRTWAPLALGMLLACGTSQSLSTTNPDIPPANKKECIVSPSTLTLSVGQSSPISIALVTGSKSIRPDSIVIVPQDRGIASAFDTQITAVEPGVTTIDIRCWDRQKVFGAEVQVTVMGAAPLPPPPAPPVVRVVDIRIIPDAESVEVRQPVRFTVLAMMSDGTSRPVDEATWGGGSANNMSRLGVFLSDKAGTYTLTATYGGITEAITVVVHERTPPPSPPPPPGAKNSPDRDGDRVPDRSDRCPGTAPGTAVLTDGCPAQPTAADTVQLAIGQIQFRLDSQWVQQHKTLVEAFVQRGGLIDVHVTAEPQELPETPALPAPRGGSRTRIESSEIRIGSQVKLCFEADSTEFQVLKHPACQVQAVETGKLLRFRWEVRPLIHDTLSFVISYRTWRTAAGIDAAGDVPDMQREFSITVAPRPRTPLEKVYDSVTDPKQAPKMLLAILAALGLLMAVLSPIRKAVAEAWRKLRKPRHKPPPGFIGNDK